MEKLNIVSPRFLQPSMFQSRASRPAHGVINLPMVEKCIENINALRLYPLLSERFSGNLVDRFKTIFAVTSIFLCHVSLPRADDWPGMQRHETLSNIRPRPTRLVSYKQQMCPAEEHDEDLSTFSTRFWICRIQRLQRLYFPVEALESFVRPMPYINEAAPPGQQSFLYKFPTKWTICSRTIRTKTHPARIVQLSILSLDTSAAIYFKNTFLCFNQLLTRCHVQLRT